MNKLRSYRLTKETGFTLVELLVVIIIIGILVAIAIPVFLNQRKRANEAAMKSDLRSIAIAYEDWSINHQGIEYPDVYKDWNFTGQYTNNHMGSLPIKLSDGVKIHAFDMSAYHAAAGYKPGEVFCIEGKHVNSKVIAVYYHSGQGGMLATGSCGSAPGAGS